MVKFIKALKGRLKEMEKSGVDTSTSPFYKALKEKIDKLENVVEK